MLYEMVLQVSLWNATLYCEILLEAELQWYFNFVKCCFCFTVAIGLFESDLARQFRKEHFVSFGKDGAKTRHEHLKGDLNEKYYIVHALSGWTLVVLLLALGIILLKVRYYGQHFSSTCLATLLHCKLKHIAARITTLLCDQLFSQQNTVLRVEATCGAK